MSEAVVLAILFFRIFFLGGPTPFHPPSAPVQRRLQGPLARSKFLAVSNIHAVVSCPNGFGKVVGISPNGNDEVTITDESGSSVSAGVDWTRL